MNKKIIISAVIALSVVSVSYMVRNEANDSKKGAVVLKKDSGQGKELEQKILAFSIDGRSPKGAKQWHLEGDSAEIIEEAIHLQKLRGVAYAEEDTIRLIADAGIYRKDPGEVELIGNVEVLSDGGIALTTERAKWSQETEEISSDQEVTIVKDNMSATGMGGMANSDEGKAVLYKDVRVKIEPSTKVRCDGSLDVDYGNNVAVFHDNVFVEDHEGKLFADTLTVEFDPGTKRLNQVIAEGNVKVKKGDSYTVSEKAIYSESTKSAKLLGRPRLILDPEQLSKLDNMGFE